MGGKLLLELARRQNIPFAGLVPDSVASGLGQIAGAILGRRVAMKRLEGQLEQEREDRLVERISRANVQMQQFNKD